MAMFTLALLYLLSISPIALANPLPNANPEPFVLPPATPVPNPGGAVAVALRHTPGHVKRVRRSLGLEEREAADQTWLLREEAKLDTRYNAGQGGFSALLAMELGKRQNGKVE
jgi:hypothetical protein